MNTSQQHKVLKQNQSIDIANGSNSPSLSASLSNMRISGDMGASQVDNNQNNTGNNTPNGTQNNFEEHILLYNVLQQLTRKVQERDQLNEVLEQENVKLKYMLMTALNYCYDTIGSAQKTEQPQQQGPPSSNNNFEYPRRNSNNTDPRMNVSSSNNSSRKGSSDQGSPRPDTRRDSQGMNISPRQQAEMMGLPVAQQEPSYDMHSSRRRSSNNSTNPQYQQLETYVMGRKPSVEYHETSPSYEMHNQERRRSNNTPSYGLENYVMPTTGQRSSQPQMQQQPPQQPQQQQDVYGDLQNYVMKKANPHPHAYQPEVYMDESSPVPPVRRGSALPLDNYVMPTNTSAQSPYHNLDAYVMGGPKIQTQIQQQPQQEPYRRSSVQVPQYIASPQQPPQHQPQQWHMDHPNQPYNMDHQNQPYTVKERKRSTSNGTEYPLDNYAMPTTRHAYTPKTPVPPQEKYFNMNDQYRRASLAFPPSSRHNQRQMGEPAQRSVDMFNMQENYMFPQQQQPQPTKRMSNPTYVQQQQQQMDFSNYRMPTANDYSSSKVTSKKKKDRVSVDERRQSHGSQQLLQQQQLPSMPPQQLQSPQLQPSQLTTPDKVFGGDASVIPARRSSVIYTPGPSPKELRQQQQQKEKERQQQLLQQQQKQEEKVDSIDNAEDCETYVSDDASPVSSGSGGQQQSQMVDDNASFVTYFSDSD